MWKYRAVLAVSRPSKCGCPQGTWVRSPPLSATTSEQAPYPSLPPGGGSSLTPLLLLFARQTLRWFAARVRTGVTALRSAPRSSAFGGRFDARSVRGIFPAAQKVNCPKGRDHPGVCRRKKWFPIPPRAAERMGNRFCYRNCNTLRRRSGLQFRDFFNRRIWPSGPPGRGAGAWPPPGRLCRRPWGCRRHGRAWPPSWR